MNRYTFISQLLVGSRCVVVLRLAGTNSFPNKALHWLRLVYVLLSSTLLIPGLAWLERRWYNKRIAAEKLSGDPVFIIGHWRSGTTLLHSLMAAGERFGTLSNEQAFMPNTMLVARKFIRRLMQFHLLPKRPMDDVFLSPDSPQEDEFALASLFGTGAYLGWIFPESLRFYFEKYCLLQNFPGPEKRAFFARYGWLVKKISFVNAGKPLLLKNPANTGRVPELLDLFPNARFIYLYRDPFEVYFSTLRLHEKLAKQFGLQTCDPGEIRRFVPAFYQKLLQKFNRDKVHVPQGQLTEVAYEDLLANPLGTLECIYRELNLDDYKTCEPAFRRFLAGQAGYRPARYPITEETRQAIYRIMGRVDTGSETDHPFIEGLKIQST